MDERGPVIAMDRAPLGSTKQLLAEEVYQRVGASIIDGTLPPGSRIRDAELAAQFGVSRMPIREALQRLERAGLVEMYPSRYTQVTHVPPELTEKTLEFVGYLGGAVAATAVPRLTIAEREEAAVLARALDDALDDGVALSAARMALVQFLAERCGNDLLRSVLQETSMPVTRNLRQWSASDDDREQMQRIHRDLADAILIGDGPAAERLVRAMHLVA